MFCLLLESCSTLLNQNKPLLLSDVLGHVDFSEMSLGVENVKAALAWILIRKILCLKVEKDFDLFLNL